MNPPSLKHQRIILLALFLITLLAYFFSIFQTSSLQKNSEDQKVPGYFSDVYWAEQIKTLGPEASYNNLKKTITGWNYSTAHQTLHIFGFALYGSLGQEGMIYCDDFQNYGCFHGFVAGFVSEHKLQDLDQTISILCNLNQNFTKERCLHGIGHGLVDYLGRYNLNESFRYCQKIGSTTYIGCPQGVLMEYFYPIHNQAKNTGRDQFDSSNIFGPCGNLDKEFQKYCYTFIPVFYWPENIVLNAVQAENYCREAQDPMNRLYCLVGTGTRLSSYFNFDLDKARQLCNGMKESDNRAYCLAGVLLNGGSNRGEIKDLYAYCDLLEKDKVTCREVIKEVTH